MPKIQGLSEWKKLHMPVDGRCTNCGKLRGTDLSQWTLIPDHMYCKYCFMANVASRDEQQRLRAAFIDTLKTGDVNTEISIEHRVIEIHDMVKMVFQHLRTKSLVTQQFLQVNNAEAARRHIRSRLPIDSADDVPGRYLIGPELHEKYGDRLEHLIENAPLSMTRDFGSVITTPAIIELHRELDGKTTPPWLERGMSLYTNDRDEYPLYSCAYVQLLARQLS